MEKFIHFLTTYGYTVVFLWVFIEQIGIPVPAMPLLLAAGALAGLGKLDPVTTILAATLAAVIADSIWYELGRRRGAGILKFLCKVSLEPDSCIQSTATSFERYGLKTLLVAKFVPGLNTISQPLAGLMRVPRPKFWMFDWVGTTLWAGTSVGLGMLFHNQLQQLADRVEQFGIWCLIGAATLLVVYLGWKYYQRQEFIRRMRVARITPEILKEKIDTGQLVTVIDLRHPRTFHESPQTIPGSLRWTTEDISRRHTEIPRDHEVVLFCA